MNSIRKKVLSNGIYLEDLSTAVNEQNQASIISNMWQRHNKMIELHKVNSGTYDTIMNERVNGINYVSGTINAYSNQLQIYNIVVELAIVKLIPDDKGMDVTTMSLNEKFLSSVPEKEDSTKCWIALYSQGKEVGWIKKTDIEKVPFGSSKLKIVNYTAVDKASIYA